MSFIIKLIFLILVYYVIHLVRSSNNSKVMYDELCSFNRSKKTNVKSNGVSEDLYQRYKEYNANHMYTKPSEGATVITRGKQELAIIYDHEVDGLYRVFNTDEMSNFIKNNTDEAFLQSIIVIDENHFALNIAPRENYAMLENSDFWKDHIEKQTLVFQPVIEKFIVEGYPYKPQEESVIDKDNDD